MAYYKGYDLPDPDNITKESLEYIKTVMKSKQDPVWFVENILNTKMFPRQAEITKKFYGYKYRGEDKPEYKNLVLGLGMRSGKTALGGMLACYEFFDITRLDCPSEHYHLLKNQPIFIPVVAPSERQVTDGVFYNIQNMLENSEWVSSWTDWKIKSDEVISPSKNVSIKPFSSSGNTGRGTTSKTVIFDEMDLFVSTLGRSGATEVYTGLSKATATLGMDGHIFVLSSIMSSTSIMSSLLAKAQYDKHTLAYKLPSWEVNPNLSKAELMEEFKFDLATFWRDYGCEPGIWSGLQFPEGVKLKEVPNLLANYPLDYPSDNHFRVMAIDPAYKNDSFGVAIGWKDEYGTYIDGVTRFRRKDGDIIIRPSMIREYIKDAVKKFKIHTLLYDALMSPDIIEMCNYELGMNVVQHNVNKEDYDLVRSLLSVDKLWIVYDVELKMEMEQLVVKNEKRVDHPMIGCFTGDTRVVLMDGTTPCISELDGKTVWVLSTDSENNPKAGLARGRKTKSVNEILEIILDSGASIKCTPEHLFMLRNGTYKKAEELKPYVDRLMPCYTTKDADGYIWYRNKEGIKAPLHRYVKDVLDDKFVVVHHKNEIKDDNRPENLEILSLSEHSRYHGYTRDHTNGVIGMYKFNTSEEGRKLRRGIGLRSPISTRTKEIERQWIEKNPYFRHDITLETLLESVKLGAENANQSSKILKCGRNVIMRVLRDNNFNSWDEFSSGLNHRIKSIYRIKLEKPIDVYDLEVEEWNNFALLAGVFVHNSKDSADAVANVVQYLNNRDAFDPNPKFLMAKGY